MTVMITVMIIGVLPSCVWVCQENHCEVWKLHTIDRWIMSVPHNLSYSWAGRSSCSNGIVILVNCWHSPWHARQLVTTLVLWNWSQKSWVLSWQIHSYTYFEEISCKFTHSNWVWAICTHPKYVRKKNLWHRHHIMSLRSQQSDCRKGLGFHSTIGPSPAPKAWSLKPVLIKFKFHPSLKRLWWLGIEKLRLLVLKNLRALWEYHLVTVTMTSIVNKPIRNITVRRTPKCLSLESLPRWVGSGGAMGVGSGDGCGASKVHTLKWSAGSLEYISLTFSDTKKCGGLVCTPPSWGPHRREGRPQSADKPTRAKLVENCLEWNGP